LEFFANLNFSSSNEDGETELAALAGARRIICLIGTGTRALDLLLSDAEEVIALDSNPVQNALLALKVAALEILDRADYLAFLGIAPSARRRECYLGIRDQLYPAARDYWDRNQGLIASGVWHAGKWEKLLGWNGRFQALFRRQAVAALMEANSISEQAEVWKRSFTGSPLRSAIETVGRDLLWRLVMREPAGAFLPAASEVGKRIESDFEKASRSFLFRQSDIATLAMRGRHDDYGALPVHLRAENYDRIRAGLSRLRPLVGGLADLARLDTSEYDGFSLSDFGSYCGPDDYAACWQGIMAVAAPGARYCERIFMNEMNLPSPHITIDRNLSEQLSNSDKSIIYRIRVGRVERA
jgi:S-adenosylmethionine-diacylglycerol 3-amino-3-carboxypropyl transferase